jgi:type II secretory pathway pseudopilin PulG
MSIRALMIAVALCALVITPVVFMYRRTVALVQAERLAAEAAKRAADQARYVAQLQAAQASLNGTNIGNANQGISGPQTADGQRNLWAAISVNRPLFTLAETKDLRIVLTLVNDGDEAIDPKIAESRIVMNGKEVANPALFIGEGSNSVRLRALGPGDRLEFNFAPGELVNEAGIFRISWKGVGFQSPEVVFRIIAERSK